MERDRLKNIEHVGWNLPPHVYYVRVGNNPYDYGAHVDTSRHHVERIPGIFPHGTLKYKIVMGPPSADDEAYKTSDQGKRELAQKTAGRTQTGKGGRRKTYTVRRNASKRTKSIKRKN